MTNISPTDIMNIKAISKSGTKLSEIMAYWDAFDRSYPNFEDFCDSISKLESFNVLIIKEKDFNFKIYNNLFEHMNFFEIVKYFLRPKDNLICRVLQRIDTKNEINSLRMTKDDYELIINLYIHSQIK